MIDCTTINGISVNRFYDTFECWTGQHIIHATFAYIISAFFIIMSLITSISYFESQSTSHDISARVNSRGETFYLITKIILLYVYFFLGEERYHWIIIILLLILSFIGFTIYFYQWPYFNDRMNKFFSVLWAIFFWSTVVLFLAKILENTDFTGGLQLYFLGLPLIIGLIIFNRDTRINLLLQNINNFQKGEEVALQIRYYLHLVTSKESERQNSIILKGYTYHHEDTCTLTECFLKQYKASIQQGSKNKKGAKKTHHQQMTANNDNHQLLMQHAKKMYKWGLTKFPICTQLKIQYAFFLMERMNNKAEELIELQQAEKLNPPFDEQFIIHRYKKVSDDYSESHTGEQNSASIDLATKHTYDSTFRQFQIHIERCAALHLEFWNDLKDDRPDMGKLNEIGSKINQCINIVEQYWSQLQKLNSNVPKSLKLYAKFLMEILNDKDSGQELMVRAKDATNVKHNYYDTNIIEDISDINTISINGTPCVYVSGDNDKMGQIINCNYGACRIYGYTMGEIKNHNVEKLMPEMYAKQHHKVLEEALSKGPENIPNKERLVFAKHKSGFVFPVWLQIKMVQNIYNGIIFIAMFKLDKKLISSNIAYILLNSDKKIQGLSSSCMKMLNLDIQKIRRMHAKGIDIHQMAPDLFDQENNEQFAQKQGGILDFFIPDFERMKSLKKQRIQQDKVITKKMDFMCHLNTIHMGEIGDIGWYIKLENVQNKQLKSQSSNKKDKEKAKQPQFQFRYDLNRGKFIRELINEKTELATKNPNFVNGYWNTPMGKQIKDDKTQSIERRTSQVIEEQKDETSKINESLDDYEKQRKKWSQGIQIYYLFDGRFYPKDYDDDKKKQQQLEEERNKKLEEDENNSSNSEIFKNNIKSRKALQLAINDKSVPKAIKNLTITMNLVIITLFALAITEFLVVQNQFSEINQNINLIKMSYNRIAEVQRIAYNVRNLILINEGIFTKYDDYISSGDFVDYMQTDITQALDSLYNLQNNISLNNLDLSDEQQQLVDNKTVSMYFKEQNNQLKILQFSLTEAVQQISSAIFTVNHFNIDKFTEMQEDVYFITYNSYNDFFTALNKSSSLYVNSLYSRSEKKNNLILILFLCSMGILASTIVIMFPVVSSVNQARMKVLTLFIDIPNYNVIQLYDKCETFLANLMEEHNEEVESEVDSTTKVEENDLSANVVVKRQGHKNPKNTAQSNKKVFIQFSIAILFIMAYFIAMFALALLYIQSIKNTASELELLAQAEPNYVFALNVEREMIYNESKPILNLDSFEVAQEYQYKLFQLNQDLIQYHYDNENSVASIYNSAFDEFYSGDLCNNQDISIQILPMPCSTFISNGAQQGLQTVLIKYFEEIKETLRVYIELNDINQSKDLFNENFFKQQFLTLFVFIKQSYRNLVDIFLLAVNDDYETTIDTRMAAFIVFLIALIVAYLMLWLPFVSKLSKEIWRTKSMLTIIPIEIILKIPRIQEFIHSQSYFSSKI